ncbi:uncharacterized protein TRAVEDRAFT_16904 [Trametes versicolor FP-101664 SS1]|uniref:uncharacterized protein n=1 Tax=Trametes versicolor (strain FP-101664) TaxID=717944 RepID=UPI0004623179|nr:uncharacterized protein TRAVEDRAFT_16904 [Trametes versicolor FP-101664 SS1]EIW65015.1 hypothetical protein TRAVEDRAFT_16904 [Trametes versicolor FP-101664 SS1]
MQSQTNSQPWNVPSDVQSLPSVDDRSTVARPSTVKRIIRRMGLSNTDGEHLSHLQGSSSSRSSGSLAKSFASNSARTVDSYRPAGLFTRMLEGRSSREELPDVADMLEDDNLAWGVPAKSAKPRRR